MKTRIGILTGGGDCPGLNAVRLIVEEKYGYMVAHHPPDTRAIPITEAIGCLRTVPLDGDIVRTARDLGISFGD